MTSRATAKASTPGGVLYCSTTPAGTRPRSLTELVRAQPVPADAATTHLSSGRSGSWATLRTGFRGSAFLALSCEGAPAGRRGFELFLGHVRRCVQERGSFHALWIF